MSEAEIGFRPAEAQLRDAKARIAELEDALRMSAERWEDLGDVIKEEGEYANAGFCHASARRCRETLSPKSETNR